MTAALGLPDEEYLLVLEIGECGGWLWRAANYYLDDD